MTQIETHPSSPASAVTTGTRRIVVGVDGSPGSRAAMKWAVHEARLTGAEIEAVNVVAPMVPLDFAGASMAATPGMWDTRELRAGAMSAIDRVVRETANGTGSSVHRVVVEDRNPGQMLLRRAHGGAMLVVGAHHHHGLGLLLGSTGASCVRHATCPVVVVPESWDPTTEWDPVGNVDRIDDLSTKGTRR